MTQINVPTSTLHKAIASIAEYLEDKFSPELFSFMDGGTTLDICSEALSQCRPDPLWQTLAQNYESLGGSISSGDDNEWDVAFLTSKTLTYPYPLKAKIFTLCVAPERGWQPKIAPNQNLKPITLRPWEEN